MEPFQFAKSLHRGQRYNVMCTVVRGDLPVSIRWFKDSQLVLPEGLGTIVGQQQTSSAGTNYGTNQASSRSQSGPEDGSSTLAIKQVDPYSSTLTFSSLQSHHRGVYTCEAQNEAGRANQSSALVIHGKFSIEPY